MQKLNAAGLKMGLEELAALIRVLELREQIASEALARADQDALICRKLLAFVKAQQADFREQLAALEQQK